MGGWVLVFWIFGSDCVSNVKIEGFTSKEACVAAAKEIDADKLMLNWSNWNCVQVR